MSQPLDRVHEADIETMLKYVMLKVGLRANNLPTKEEKFLLIDHIRRNFSNVRLDEIRLAFDMAINEELDLNPDDTKCYENFSCQYFSRIMNAYLSWAAQETRFLKSEPPEQKIYTDEENDNLYRQLTEELFQQIKKGRVPHDIPDYVEYILKKDGLLKSDGSVVNFFIYRIGLQIGNIYEKVE